MAYFGISASDAGPAPAVAGEALEASLGRLLAGVGPGSPIVVMIHGYRYRPDGDQNNPHRSLFAFRPDSTCRRVRSWPTGLGFAPDSGESGLAVGFGWPAHERHVPNLLRHGRSGFATVYRRAGDYGAHLAMVVSLIQRLAPGHPVDLLAHSLGARVALAALPFLREAPGRVILLGAAEFDGRAIDALEASKAAGEPQVYNVTARANDPFDFGFETLAPHRRGERALGRGLRVARGNWLDLQLDRSEVTTWVNERGIRLRPPDARLCHWGFYTRRGALAVYREILNRRPGWDVATLRTVPSLAEQEPRWSRLMRRLGPVTDEALDFDGQVAFE